MDGVAVEWNSRCFTLPSMGFNPFRPQDKTRLDVYIVVAFALITLGFVLWGFFG